jgi:FKBP-type peptidyl-prolyl cis-trans isomerase FkpA
MGLPGPERACQKPLGMTRFFVPLSLLLCATPAACSKGASEPAVSDFKPAPPTPADPGPATLEKTDDVVGKGAVAKTGDLVRVHYTGTLMNGTKFDSSRDRGTPFDFKLGQAAVIKGWDQGVVGMKVGGKRRLSIPQALAYGDDGRPPEIPPKAGLKFEIELLDVNPKDGGAGEAPAFQPESEEPFMPPMDEGEDEESP